MGSPNEALLPLVDKVQKISHKYEKVRNIESACLDLGKSNELDQLMSTSFFKSFIIFIFLCGAGG